MNFQSGQMIADKYVLDGELGQGGIATVYKMHHVKLETPFALKILKISTPSLKQRLELEAKVQAKIRHPNVVSVLDVIEEEGFLGLVMEFVEGVALDSFLLQERLTLDEAEEIFLAILDAMEEAHENSIVHRDLKPGNVMIQKKRGRFQVKVCDFGLAKALDDEGASNTVSGTTMGTPAYMAPEQVRNSKTVDQKADVFSLGAILYEMVSGQKAFSGTTTWEILSAVTEKQPPSIKTLVPDIPERFAGAINGSLQKQVTKRIPSCTELREVLLGKKSWTPSKSDSLIMDGFDLMSGEYTIETADLDIDTLSALEEEERKEQAQQSTEKKTQKATPAPQEGTPEKQKVQQRPQNDTPSVAAPPPPAELAPEEKSSSTMLILVAVVVLLLGGGGAFALMGQNTESKDVSSGSEETPATKVENKTNTALEKPETEQKSEAAAEKKDEVPPVESTKTAAVKTAPPKTETKTITPVSNTGSTTKTPVKKEETTTAPTKTAATTALKKLDAQTTKSIVTGFDSKTRSSRRIQDCFAAEQKLSGTAPTRVPLIVTLENTGKVSSATVSEGEYAGSSFETCLQSKLKSLQYDSFDPAAKPIKFKYKITR